MKVNSCLFSALLACVAVTSCAVETTGPNTDALEKTLADLNMQDPSQDAATHFREGDLRFIGINSYTCWYPGQQSPAMERLVLKYRLRCLVGTSDAIESKRHELLLDHVTNYGISYNRALVRLIQERDAP